MTNRPLYIVDMTIYEFLNILKLISGLDDQLSIKEKKFLLKKEITNMLGTIPMDEGKPPRRLSSSKNKMVQNFMITINQLDLLENLTDSKNLYLLFKVDKEKFFEKLRKLLLFKGNLYDYVRAIEKVNQMEDIKNKSQYIEKLVYEVYKIYPHISKNAHKKQSQYIFKWLRDKRLAIIELVKDNKIKIYKSNVKI